MKRSVITPNHRTGNDPALRGVDEVFDDVVATRRLTVERSGVALRTEAWARVDDTGVGIDENDLPRVFDVAYRGSNGRMPRSDSSLPSGSGLGLAIAAGLVRAHRGTSSAYNLDTGARFEVRLPLALDE